MIYGPGWIPPWREGSPLARCLGKNCTQDGVPGLLVVAVTLSSEGLCAQCARTPAGEDAQRLRLDVP